MAFSTHDIVPDSPTNNFATWNKSDEYASTLNLSEGNLRVYSDQATWWDAYTTISMSQSGKYYCEMHALSDAVQHCFGVCTTSAIDNLGTGNGGVTYHTNFSSGASYYYGGGGNRVSNVNGVQTVVSSGTLLSSSTNDIIGILLDLDNDTVKFYIDNSLVGTTSSIISGNYVFFYNYQMNQNQSGVVANFGQDPTFGGSKSPTTTYTDANGIGAFYYDPTAIDSEALALCTANLPEMTPDVDDDTPQDYFEAVTYTGNGTGQSITGIGFQPDLVWVKKRSASGNHFLVDSVSGANKELNSNNTAAQVNNTGGIQSLNPTSFTVGIDGGVNGSSETYVAWCWKAGGAPTADNSNTSGAMTANSVSLNGTLQSNYTPAGSPTVYPKRMSINTDAGFSIVKYTGTGSSADLPHGLNKAPEFILIKNIEVANSWAVYHVSLGPQKQFLLNSTNGSSSDINGFDATPTTNYVNLGSGASMDTNQTGTHIMYCWHSVEGYSKFGSYVGNGSADGPFIYTGFKPSFLIIKDTTSAGGWFILDNARNQYNPVNSYLLAQSSGTEDPNNSTVDYDFVSNGIKVRATSTNLNTNNNVYIFMAFAEMPFKYANAR
jgi:hypothetical protein